MSVVAEFKRGDIVRVTLEGIEYLCIVHEAHRSGYFSTHYLSDPSKARKGKALHEYSVQPVALILKNTSGKEECMFFNCEEIRFEVFDHELSKVFLHERVLSKLKRI